LYSLHNNFLIQNNAILAEYSNEVQRDIYEIQTICFAGIVYKEIEGMAYKKPLLTFSIVEKLLILWLIFFNYGLLEWLWRSLIMFTSYPFIIKKTIILSDSLKAEMTNYRGRTIP